MVDVTGTSVFRGDNAGITSVSGTMVDGSGNIYLQVVPRSNSLPVSSANPLPSKMQDSATIAGSITTQNLVPAGVATAGSAVSATGMSGTSSATIQITGVYTGALSAQGSVDGTTFVTLPSILNVGTNVFAATIATAVVGIFQVNTTGLTAFRITGLAAVTGTATVTIQVTSGVGSIGIEVPIITGTNSIGKIGITGNAFATLDGAINAAAPTNAIWNTSCPSTSAAACALFSATAGLTTASVKATQASLFGMSVDNPNASTIFVQFYNQNTVPTLGTGVIIWFAVLANSTLVITPSDIGLANFATGLGVGVATTANGAVAPASAPNVVVYYR